MTVYLDTSQLSPSWFIRRDRSQGHEVPQRSCATTHRRSDVFHRHNQPVPGSAPLDSRFEVQLPRSTVRFVVHTLTRFTDIHADIRLHVVRGRLLPVRLLPGPDRRHRPLTVNDDRRQTRNCSAFAPVVDSTFSTVASGIFLCPGCLVSFPYFSDTLHDSFEIIHLD